MRLKDVWKNKVDLKDDVYAKDVNVLAEHIIEAEEIILPKFTLTQETEKPGWFKICTIPSIFTYGDDSGFTLNISGRFARDFVRNIDNYDAVVTVNGPHTDNTLIQVSGIDISEKLMYSISMADGSTKTLYIYKEPLERIYITGIIHGYNNPIAGQELKFYSEDYLTFTENVAAGHLCNYYTIPSAQKAYKDGNGNTIPEHYVAKSDLPNVSKEVENNILPKVSNVLQDTKTQILPESQDILRCYTNGFLQDISTTCKIIPRYVSDYENLINNYNGSQTINEVTFTVSTGGRIHVSSNGKRTTKAAVYVINASVILDSGLYGFSCRPQFNTFEGKCFIYCRDVSTNTTKMQEVYKSTTDIVYNDTCLNPPELIVKISVQPDTIIDMVVTPTIFRMPDTLRIGIGGKMRTLYSEDNNFSLTVPFEGHEFKIGNSDYGVEATATYNRDIMDAYTELKQAIISLGGNI